MNTTTIGLLSDLHLEHHADGGQEFIRQVIKPLGQQVDVLVLAGDICSGKQLGLVLPHICDLAEAVVFVAGNHEFYHSSVNHVVNKLHKLASRIPNLTWLDCKVAVVAGVRFVGGTLWFPKPQDKVYAKRKQVNDFNLIKGFEPWVYQEHNRCVAMLNMAASTADVVVTHHVPSIHGNAPQWRGSPINHYFVCDMTPLIEAKKPPLWLYGHTHDSHDVMVGRTRLVANPFGYPHEQGMSGLRFNSRLLIDVPTSLSPTVSSGKRSGSGSAAGPRPEPSSTPPESIDDV